MNKELPIKIFNKSRSDLLINFKYLTKAIYALDYKSNSYSIGTDGLYFYYEERNVLVNYLRDRNYPTRTFFHAIIHCVLKHPFIFNGSDELENLACDIVVESIIDDLQKTKLTYDEDKIQTKEIIKIKKEVNFFIPKYIKAYLNSLQSEEIVRLKSIFTKDDHMFWKKGSSDFQTYKDRENDETKSSGNSGSPAKTNNNSDEENQSDNRSINNNILTISKSYREAEERWQEIAEELSMDLKTFSRTQGSQAGDFIFNLSNLERDKENYDSFLKQFAVMSEVMKSNPDEFDIIYYTYGMDLYHNVALVEPLEYRDEKRIKEFVIAIDTSGSVYGRLVESFLKKTYSILKSEDSFHKRINIHIIQCDSKIQRVDVIKNQFEIEEYIRNLSLRGFGGTDFRPVFNYIDERIKEGEFRNLQGIIYFTDGMGTFPVYRPGYKAAFIFMEDINIPKVPPWAIKHVLKEKELS